MIAGFFFVLVAWDRSVWNVPAKHGKGKSKMTFFLPKKLTQFQLIFSKTGSTIFFGLKFVNDVTGDPVYMSLVSFKQSLKKKSLTHNGIGDLPISQKIKKNINGVPILVFAQLKPDKK